MISGVDSFGGIAVLASFVISGTVAFFTLSTQEDGNVRMFALGALTLGLFIGFSILWTMLGSYLMWRYADNPVIDVPFWGVEAGIAVASVLCGLVFARRSAQAAPPHLTQIDRKWMTSSRSAFRTGLLIALVTPTGSAAIIYTVFAVYGLVTGQNLFR
jgi:hypothetical protein